MVQDCDSMILQSHVTLKKWNYYPVRWDTVLHYIPVHNDNKVINWSFHQSDAK